jgi:hypothetical protein
MPEKCVYQTAGYSTLFCATSIGITQSTRIQFVEVFSTYEREETWVEVVVGNLKEKRLLE